LHSSLISLLFLLSSIPLGFALSGLFGRLEGQEREGKGHRNRRSANEETIKERPSFLTKERRSLQMLNIIQEGSLLSK
jgi:hypothetical protein